MNGMLMKDLMVARKTMKVYAIFLLGYLCLSLVGGFGVSLCLAMSQVVVMMMPIAAFSYDETAKWSRYAATMPQGRRLVVQGRYAFSLVLLAIVSAYDLLVCTVMSILGKVDLVEGLGSVLGATVAGIAILCVMIPLCYHLGVERARPFLYLIVLSPVVLVFLLSKLDFFQSLDLSGISESTVMLVLAGLVLLVLAAFFVSYLVSLRVVLKKEY